MFHKLVALSLVILFTTFLFFDLNKAQTKPVFVSATDSEVRYLPLGDSYTIGQGVAESVRWPNQLVKQINNSGQSIAIIGNPARTGNTTYDLIQNQLPLVASTQPDLISIQIGVNDYVQNIGAKQFEANLKLIVSTVISEVPESTLFLVTIPDFGQSPSGAVFGTPDVISEDIKKFNAIIIQVGKEYGVVVADIYPKSLPTDTADWYAPDLLHPSAAQYASWVTVIQNVVPKQL